MYTMTFTLAAIVILSLITAKLVHNQHTAKRRIQLGLKLALHLNKLIDQCQKHRGTSNAILIGEHSLMPNLVFIQKEIDQLINDDLSLHFQRYPQWESFTEHWPRLKAHTLAGDLKPHNQVRQHNLMIEGQISLMDDLMRFHDLHKLMIDSTTRVSELCLDTLRVAETIGQTRAVGSGICSHGQCDEADRIILNFLRISVKSSTDRLIRELSAIENKDLSSRFDTTSKLINNSVSSLVDVIEHQIMIEGKLRVKAAHYFSISTKALDEVYKLFSVIIQYASKQHIQMV